MALKNLISSPLEAGQSVLDAHRLPCQLDAALEYTARRLARKSLSIDLVVVRREYQLPQASQSAKAEEEKPRQPSSIDITSSADNYMSKPLPPLPLNASAPTPPTSASSASSASSSRFASALKGLVRSNTVPSQALPSPNTASSSKRADGKTKWPFSPSRSLSSASAASSPSFPSISSPLFFSSAFASMPATPCTPASPNTDASMDSFSTMSSSIHSQMSASTNTNTHGHHHSVSRSSSVSSLSPLSFGIRLVHADALPRSHKRILCQILAKAAQRFHLPSNWLPMPVPAAAMGLPAHLVSRSVAQNQILFQGDNNTGSSGLVLRSLDHLFTFKAALCSYAQTGDRYRLEDAVDELRRYILLAMSTSKRSLAKRELLRQYPELSCFADRHIADVNRMYSRAYGGPDGESGIAGDGLSLSPPPSADDDEEARTPIATTVDDSAFVSSVVSASPVKTRRRRPTGMIFARPDADDRLTIVDCAPPTASSLSSMSTVSSMSSMPSLSLSMGSSVEEVMEHMLLMQAEAETDDNVSPMTPENTENTESAENPEVEQPKEQAVNVVSPMTPEATILFRPMARSFMPASPTSPSRLPLLKLQTTFTEDKHKKEKKRLTITIDDDEQLTARPVSCVRRTFFGGAGLGSSIGEVLDAQKQRRSADTILTLASPLSAVDDPLSATGPVPPRSYDDISPITRSEWGFLKGDLMGRQVTVTTF